MLTLAEIANSIDAEFKGDGSVVIDSVATLQSAQKGQIAFLANSRYRKYLKNTLASAVVLSENDLADCHVNAIVSSNPYLAYAKIATLLNPTPAIEPGIHESAVISDECQIGNNVEIGAHVVIERGVHIADDVYIGPGCVIARDTIIGEGSRLVANVTVCHGCNIGKRALIHPGVVIGADGFGIAPDQGKWLKVPQIGGVVVGDDVEIGANTTIDRGALDDTVISDGVKLDNQVQVAHNVHIGENTAVAGCVGIAGSTRIGKRCQIGGGVGIVGHLTLVDDVHVTAMSLVTGNVNKPGLYSSGTPLESNKQWHKNAARYKKLDEMARNLKSLERKIEK